MMKMYFTTHFNDLHVLFEGWKITSVAGLAMSVVIVFALSVVFEFLKAYVTSRYQNPKSSGEERPLVNDSMSFLPRFDLKRNLAKTFFFILNLIYGYLLMLIAMTFNVWLFLALVIGFGVGYWVSQPHFGLNVEASQDTGTQLSYSSSSLPRENHCEIPWLVSNCNGTELQNDSRKLNVTLAACTKKNLSKLYMAAFSSDSRSFNVVIEPWKILSDKGLTGSFVAVFALAVLSECIKYYNNYRLYNPSQTKRNIVSVNERFGFLATATVMSMIQNTLVYCLMLVVMTYNVWLLVAILLGTGAGYLIFVPLLERYMYIKYINSSIRRYHEPITAT